MTPRQAGLLGLLAALWGASYLLIKYGLDDFSPACVVFLRTAIGAVVLLGVVLLQGGEVRRALADVRRRPGLALLLGCSRCRSRSPPRPPMPPGCDRCCR